MSGISRVTIQPQLPRVEAAPRETAKEILPLYRNTDELLRYVTSQQQSIASLYDMLARSVNDRHMVGIATERPTAGEAGRQYLTTDSTPDTFQIDDGTSWQTFPAWSVPLAVSLGGTGLTSYAVGDLLYASGTTTISKLADVAAGSFLRSGGVATAPAWSTVTIPNAATTGDLWYASATSTISALAKGTNNYFLKQGASIPAWFNLFGTENIWTELQTFYKVITGTSGGDYISLNASSEANPTGHSTATLVGAVCKAYSNGSNAYNLNAGGALQGAYIYASHQGSGTVNGSIVGATMRAIKNSTGPVATAYGAILAVDNNDASGAITTGYGLYVAPFTRTGAITTSWGVYVADTTAVNYFGNNIGIGTTTFGTSATQVLGILNGTQPSTSPANMIQIYSKDSSAGSANATLALRTEQAVEAVGVYTASHKLRVWINGVEYYVLLDAV